MSTRRMFLASLFALASLASFACAEDSCPALSRPDAVAALAAAADSMTLTTSYQSPKKYTCTFAAGTSRLIVTVAPYRFQDGWTSYTAQCGDNASALPGIGNEAVACPKDGSMMVLAHVTDTFFKLTLSVPGGSDGGSNAARKAARAVAGNLR